MHASDDNESITDDAVIEAVWKAIQEDPPCTSVDHGISIWMLEDEERRPLHGLEKLFSKTKPLRLIPLLSCLDVGRGGGPKSRLPHCLRP